MNNVTDITKKKHIIKFIVNSLENDANWEFNENNQDQLINRALGIKIKCTLLYTIITAFNGGNQPAKIRVDNSWWDSGGLRKAIAKRTDICLDSKETESDDAVTQRFIKIVKENTNKG
jgi:hypothetical protein